MRLDALVRSGNCHLALNILHIEDSRLAVILNKTASTILRMKTVFRPKLARDPSNSADFSHSRKAKQAVWREIRDCVLSHRLLLFLIENKII